MSNTIAAGVDVAEASMEAEQAAYDALPAAVRAYLADCPVKWGAQSVAEALAEAGDVPELLRHMAMAEAYERQEFGRLYRAAHGRDLPHIAAGVTPLRRLPPAQPLSARKLAA